MKSLLTLVSVFMLSASAHAESFLIENVRIFNGVDPELTSGHVLVEDGLIASISEDQIAAPEGATVIDGGNRVLSPGFIDLHVHLTMHASAREARGHSTVAGAYAVDAARHFLDSGFTTVRDAGGTHPDLARAFNSGSLYGPRVFPSRPGVSRTKPRR